jgi:O-antigen/teichoic acid export membrane protein
MSAQDVITVSAAVVALVQLAKWAGVPDGKGPIVVLVLSLLGVAFWGYSVGNYTRETAFAYFAAWIAVSTSAAGVFGFTRQANTAITATKEPPSGAGASPTVRG